MKQLEHFQVKTSPLENLLLLDCTKLNKKAVIFIRWLLMVIACYGIQLTVTTSFHNHIPPVYNCKILMC